jgi:putative hydrolase of the HAD superfamily
MTPISLICFDLGGVVIRHHRSWAQACGAVGLPVRAGIDAPGLVERRRSLTREFQCGRVGPGEFLDRLADATDRLYTREEVERLHDAWIFGEYEGVADLLRVLGRVPGLTTAALSNTNALHWERMVTGRGGRPPDLPAPTLLHLRHASHLLGLVKPDAAIYEAFERETGFRGSQILFFDDLPENVDAARRLGWRAVAVDHTGDTAAQIAGALAMHGIAIPDRRFA